MTQQQDQDLHRRPARHDRPADPRPAEGSAGHRAARAADGRPQGPRQAGRDRQVGRHRRALPARRGGQGAGGRPRRRRHLRDRRQHGASRRRRLDLRLPRARQGAAPEAARLQAHQQSRLLSDRRHRHPAAAGRCRHRARRCDARRVRRLGLHRRRQGADRGPREDARRRAVRPLRRRAHAQARAGDEEVLRTSSTRRCSCRRSATTPRACW